MSEALRERLSSAEAKYERFCFHPEARVQQVISWLEDPAAVPVLLLSGEPGSGRSYLVEAAVHRRKSFFGREQLHRLELEGYGEGRQGLLGSLDLELEKAEARKQSERAERLGALRDFVREAEVNVPGAPWLVLVVALAVPLRIARALLPGGDPAVPGPRRSAPDAIRVLCDALCAEGPALLLFPEGTPLLTDPLRATLLGEARRRRNLKLAFLCRPRDRTDSIVRGIELRRLEVPALTEAALAEVLADRFPNTFPSGLVERLHRASHGSPEYIARKMADLIGHDLVREDRRGTWRLTEGAQASVGWGQLFEAEALASIDSLRLQTKGRIGEILSQLLDLAPLCGDVFPVEPLLEHLEADRETADAIIDLLDEKLVGDGRDDKPLIDHQHTHPSFPGQLTYRFADPAVRSGLMKEVEGKAPNLARGLLGFLRRAGPPTTRGWARLELELSAFLETDEEREELLREMGWWVEAAEVEALTEQVRQDLEQGRLDVERLLGLVRNISDAFPHRRMAVLDAIQTSGFTLPAERIFAYHFDRAEALRRLGRNPEGLQEVRLARRLAEAEAPGPHQNLGAALTLEGSLCRVLGELRVARETSQRALDNERVVWGEEHPEVATCTNNLGVVLHSLGDLAGAREHHEQALMIRRARLGEDHPDVATSLSNLGTVLYDLGDLAGAREHQEQALAIYRARLGEGHPRVAMSLGNLGTVLHDLGDLTGAREHHEQALAIRRARLGEHHPDVATSLNNLGSVFQDLGDLEGAREHFEQALRIFRARLGEDHPDVATSLNNLGRVLHDFGELKAARENHEKALRIYRMRLPNDHWRIGWCLSNLALVFASTGEKEEACTTWRQALALLEGQLPERNRDLREARRAFEQHCASSLRLD